MKIITVYDIAYDSFLIKPDTALLRNNDAYYIPSFTKKVELYTYISVKITRLAKSIDKQFASRLWEDMSMAVEMRAVDILEECKASGLPWDIAFSYDKSTAVSNSSIPIADEMSFEVQKSDATILIGNTYNLSDTIDTTLAMISQSVTLKIGDMVLIPLPSDTVEVKIGDYVTARCNGTMLLDFDIK